MLKMKDTVAEHMIRETASSKRWEKVFVGREEKKKTWVLLKLRRI